MSESCSNPDADNTFESLVRKHARDLASIMEDDTYFHPDIPPKKLGKAVKKYAPTIDANRVIALHDNTLFGSADEGYLITNAGFYFKDTFSAPVQVNFNSIEHLNLKPSTDKKGNDTSTLEVVTREGSVEFSSSLKIQALYRFFTDVVEAKEQGLTKDIDGYVIIQDMSEDAKVGYLKLLVWLTFQNDGTIDAKELSELHVLMVQLNFDAPARHEVRAAISSPDALDADALAGHVKGLVPSGSEKAFGVSLLKDAVRVHRATSEGPAGDSEGIRRLARLFEINDEQLAFIEEACIQDEKILAGEIKDDMMMASAKELAKKASAVGVPVAAVYLSGSVVGLSAAGITSGLSALGLGGILGLSSMVTGIGVVILLGVGAYKGMQWVLGSSERDKASRRELMLQEVLRIHQKSIANLAADISHIAEKVIELTQAAANNSCVIEKLSRELTIFTKAMTQLRTREDSFERDLESEANKKAA